MTDKKFNMIMQMNELNVFEDDITLKTAKFSIIDDGLSYNKGLTGKRQQLSKDALDEVMNSVKDKPVYAKYFKVSEAGAEDDHLGTHEEFLDEDRDGNEYINTDTVPIGHFIENGHYEEIDGKNVIVANAVLYAEKYRDIIALLEEWLDNDIKINTSCEYLYKNYEVVDDIEIVNTPIILAGHTILNSEKRGDSKVVLGAYETSMLLSTNNKQKWNEALNSMLISSNTKDNENENEDTKENLRSDNMSKEKMLKKVCELSHEDIRWKLYDKLESSMTAEEYWDAYITEVYDDRFIYGIYDEESKKYIYYEVNYTKTDDDIEINFEGKQMVERDWVAVSNELEETKTELEKVTNELAQTKEELVSKKESAIISSHNEKESNSKISKLEEELKSANEKLEKLVEIEKEYNKDQKEKALNAIKEEYEPKFVQLNAKETFESEDVQTMIEQSVDDEAILTQLNSILVGLMSTKENKTETEEEGLEKSTNAQKGDILEPTSKSMNNLVPEASTVEEKYFK